MSGPGPTKVSGSKRSSPKIWLGLSGDGRWIWIIQSERDSYSLAADEWPEWWDGRELQTSSCHFQVVSMLILSVVNLLILMRSNLFVVVSCHRDFDFTLISHILVSVTLKDTKAGLKFLQSDKGEERWAVCLCCIVSNFFYLILSVKFKKIYSWFEAPFFMKSPHWMPKTTWKTSKGCIYSVVSTSFHQRRRWTNRHQSRHQQAGSSPWSPVWRRSWSSRCCVWLTLCSTATPLM